MKKAGFLFICIFLMLFLFSCGNNENAETEKIKVVNMTDEDVMIYYYGILDIEMMKTIIRRDDAKVVNFAPDTIYSARGEKSKKEYGDRIFSKMPSNVDVQRVWMIM